ncbi:hypothetical protein HFC70_17210 [Agrobacterium sp. a22-2]|uniref:hypothetical protein n=1 Tax=Agrobacterium sp. a22-2 TaxID=2283840 RepID=UPI00144632DF|nr:hypothetical protein [Agrobacterium sp. a22-2]NKN38094.1 hypothetical protein [Agrobacterium sp. a22-2]
MTKGWKRLCCWLALIILTTLFFAVFFFAYSNPILTEAFFCKGDSSCFREWVGAGSGWVTALFALWTIREMKRIQQESANIQLQGNKALARRINHLSKVHFYRITRLRRLFRNKETVEVIFSHKNLKDIEQLTYTFMSNIFEEFDKIAFVPSAYIDVIRTNMELFKDKVEYNKTDQEDQRCATLKGAENCALFSETLKIAAQHNRRIKKASDRFITRWAHTES